MTYSRYAEAVRLKHDDRSLIVKQERLAGEDSRHTWTITIESFMGERNKIKSADKKKAAYDRRLLCVCGRDSALSAHFNTSS